MKRVLLLLGAVALAAGCSSNKNSTSSSGGSTTSTSTSTTTGGSSTTTSSTTTTGGSTGQTTSSTTSSTGSTGTTGSGSSGSTSGGSSGSSGSVTCDGAGVANDSCTAPTVLTAEVAATGDTTNAKHDFTLDQNGTCVANNSLFGLDGNDETFTFTAPTAAMYEFTATPTDSTLDPVLIVSDTCAATVSTCSGASDQGGAGTAESVKLSLTQGQTVQIVVGAYDCQSNGPFSLLAHQLPPPPANDVCSGSVALNPDGGDASTDGDTSSAASDYVSPNCGGRGPDVFYTLVVPASSRVTLTATTPTDAGNLEAVIDLLNGCPFPDGGSSEITCAAAPSANTTGTLDIPSLAAGTYTVVLDGLNGSAGPYTLGVALAAPVAPPANDNCSAPSEIALATSGDGGQIGQVSFDTFGALDDVQPDANGQCAGAYTSAGDVVFHVTLPTAGTAYTVNLLDADGGADPGYAAIIARNAPCATGAELMCGFGSISVPASDGGTDGFIWVDNGVGLPAFTGSVQVTVP